MQSPEVHQHLCGPLTALARGRLQMDIEAKEC
jgi:hypothetical protein